MGHQPQFLVWRVAGLTGGLKAVHPAALPVVEDGSGAIVIYGMAVIGAKLCRTVKGTDAPARLRRRWYAAASHLKSPPPGAAVLEPREGGSDSGLCVAQMGCRRPHRPPMGRIP